MRFHWAILAAALLAASPAHAERLQFDHRLYPPLQKVLDSGDSAMVDFNGKNPSRLVDLIAIKGKSAKSWTEAVEIISILPVTNVAGAQGWMEAMQSQLQARCKATFEVLARDDNSITFERRSPGCSSERSSQGIYRLVTGKRSWFHLAVLTKGELDPEARRQWLALLATARIE